MKAVVTGAAGFVGSHLTEALLSGGFSVFGIDCFTDYYDPAAKVRNLAVARASRQFELIESDLVTMDILPIVENADVVFHLAGQPGVRRSWRDGFGEYVDRNVLATQRLLEACAKARVERMVYASSSSVYGNADRYPSRESDLPRPFSPYGVTKLAAEHLCTLYAENFGLHVTSVRYFTVYGPRQRPDMAIHRLLNALAGGAAFPLYGDGHQRRDFTFVLDAVAATRLGSSADVPPGSVFNVGGGSDVSMIELIELAQDVSGRELLIDHHQAEPGDARRTGADTTAARTQLGWEPTTTMREGVTAQWQSLQVG